MRWYIYDQHYRANIWIIQCTVPSFKKWMRWKFNIPPDSPRLEISRETQARFMPLEGVGYIVYFKPGQVELNTMVHETHHLARVILYEDRGIDDEEAEAYFQEHLFSQIYHKFRGKAIYDEFKILPDSDYSYPF